MKHLIICFLWCIISVPFALADLIQGEQEKIYHFDELDGLPAPLTELEPTYPYGLKKLSKKGRVVLWIKIDKDGNVFAPTVLESSRASLLKSSLYAVFEWKFHPGKKDGLAVNSRAKVTIDFNGEDAVVSLSKAESAERHSSRHEPNAQLIGLSEAPEAIKRVQPVYPMKEKRNRVNGRASISFIIDEQGKPQRLTVEDFSRREFIVPSLVAMSQWEFKPGKIEGVPVKTRVRIPFSFKLRR